MKTQNPKIKLEPRDNLADKREGVVTPIVRTRPGGRTARIGRKVEQVVVQLMTERGYSDWSFKEVAEAAGVNRSTLYRRWPNRAALVLAAIRRIIITYVVLEDTGSLKGDLRVALLKITDVLSSQYGEALVMAVLDLQQKGELPINHVVSWTVGAPHVLAMFERAKARGDIPDDFDAEATFGMLAGALYYRMIGMGETPDEAWVDRIMASYVDHRTKF